MQTENYLAHVGTPHDGIVPHSGRHPWGSGKNPFQRTNKDFLMQVRQHRREGMSNTDIAAVMNYSTTEFIQQLSNARNEERVNHINTACRLYYENNMTPTEIGREMGVNESTVRSWLNPRLKERALATQKVADFLKENVDVRGMIDVGKGTELDLGVSQTKLNTAIKLLQDQGYNKYAIKVMQPGTGEYTTIKVLAPPDVGYAEAYKNRFNIRPLTEYETSQERTALGIKPPVSIDSSRIMVRYAEDGGTEKDGVIELKRGVEDISLGNARYAQVRIGVDDTHYLKGMAMYTDKDMPEGVDIIFNTNKHKGTPLIDESGGNEVLKRMKINKETGKIDEDNPFGATIKFDGGQREYKDAEGNTKLSPINIVNSEGDWGTWSKSLASQMLSKQTVQLAKKQLDLAYAYKKDEYDEISQLTNPTVKKTLLNSFASDCDSSAVHLKAAALPRQASHVILPMESLSDREIYAPSYKNGEEVVLIRYPHGGIFEIPRLTVNNNNKEAKSLIFNAKDAVGINSKVAERLSGADFDGDTVLVIPTKGVKIRTSSPLKGLEDFDPKEEYRGYDGMKEMGARTKQNEMGRISNLITDMTLKGATPDELARAVRHSMVVIDAEKHKLNYQQSEKDNGIRQLREKYQPKEVGPAGGASTLISRAKGEVRVPERRLLYKPDPETGARRYKETGETYIKRKKDPETGEYVTVLNRDGTPKVIERQTKTTQMELVDDARVLSSGTPMENLYADYANRLKSLANTARKEAYNTPSLKYSPSANKTYVQEVESLDRKLRIAEKNAPKERQAILRANMIMSEKKKSNPTMDSDTEKKLRNQALAGARAAVGAKKTLIEFEGREWEAVQAGAITDTKLKRILNNSDLDEVKKLATPKQTSSLSNAKISLIKAKSASGYSISEIAEDMGISTATVTKYLD